MAPDHSAEAVRLTPNRVPPSSEWRPEMEHGADPRKPRKRRSRELFPYPTSAGHETQSRHKDRDNAADSSGARVVADLEEKRSPAQGGTEAGHRRNLGVVDRGQVPAHPGQHRREALLV